MNGTPVFAEIRGEWAVANAGDNVGFTGTRETLAELPPVGEIAKLLVLQKRVEDPIAYAWSRGAREYGGRRLWGGETRVDALLSIRAAPLAPAGHRRRTPRPRRTRRGSRPDPVAFPS